MAEKPNSCDQDATVSVERDNQLWDEEIARDLAAGKLDELIAEAKAELAAGKARACRVQ